MDVAKKFICLARELGSDVSLEDVKLLNLVPKALYKDSVSDFLKKLDKHQEQIENKIKKILEKNVAIAYVGIIDHGKINIQLNGYPAHHRFANAVGIDNILLIQSKRYKQPLIIQGPGAGKEVTAGGIFAELLKLVSIL